MCLRADTLRSSTCERKPDRTTCSESSLFIVKPCPKTRDGFTFALDRGRSYMCYVYFSDKSICMNSYGSKAWTPSVRKSSPLRVTMMFTAFAVAQ